MLYTIARALLVAYYHVFFRLSVTGGANVPAAGPVIYCANHSSNHDPLVLGAAAKRPVHFLAKRELFKYKPFAAVLKGVNAIPTKRNTADMASYKEALTVLSNGEALGIFAQGHRMKEMDVKDVKAGVALYALKGGAEVVPVRIEAKYRLFGEIKVTIGAPVDLSEYRGKKIKTDMLNEAAELIFSRIMAL